jgi:hypothetical protein
VGTSQRRRFLMVMQLWRVRKIVFGGLLFRRRVWEELED